MKFSLIGSDKRTLIALGSCGWLLLFFLTACIDLPIQQGQDDTMQNAPIDKPFTTQNHLYEPKVIKTVRFYGAESSGNLKQYFNPPIVALGQFQSIVLEFDVMDVTPLSLQAKIVHCNMDWTPSKLLEMEFINEINEFQVQRYENSFRTKVNYLHYQFTVPKVKLSGNYVLVLYRNGNQEDRMLTRRFMIYENKVSISPEIRNPNFSDARDKKQQIDVRLGFRDYNVINAREDFQMVMRQNFRWDNALYNLKPTQVRDFDHLAEYMPLDGSNHFEGLNEYRRFDARSTRFLGYRIGGLNLKDSLSLEVETDLSRANTPYFHFPDSNGNFIVGRQDAQVQQVEADYVYIKFRLKIPKMEEEIYVLGAFNDWQASSENKMQYDDKKKYYEATIYLKQGEYNYQYAIKRNDKLDETTLEGSYFSTENDYDVWVYHKPLGARSEKIVGYKKFNTFQAN